MSKNMTRMFGYFLGSHCHHPGRFKGSDVETVSSPAASPCLTWAFLLSLPLWGAIWAVAVAVRSAWPS
jgi:hypothetical protein